MSDSLDDRRRAAGTRPPVKQGSRGAEGDLPLNASSTTGNEDDAGTLYVEDALAGAAGGGSDTGSRLGAASGVETMGTAGAPPAMPGGGDAPMEMDWGGGGRGTGVSGTGGRAAADEGDLTHPPVSGMDTTRTTGGFVQHPNDSALSLADASGGVGYGQHNQEVAAGEGGAYGDVTTSRALGGGQAGTRNPVPPTTDEATSGDDVRSAT